MISLASSPVAALTSILTTDTAWQLDGLCNQTDPDAFFPDRGSSSSHAKAVCKSCPVRATCLEYAIDRNERYGVWGGMSEDERRQLRRKRAAAQKTNSLPEPAPKPELAVVETANPQHRPYSGGNPPAACGTEAAHRRHKRRREPVDEACALAHIAYLDATREMRKVWRRRSKARSRTRQGPRVLEPCGTPAAYSRHQRRGEKACDACRVAHNEARRKYGRKPQAASQPATDTARAWNSFQHFRPQGWQKPKLTNEQWTQIHKRLAAGETAQDIALDYQVTASTIRARAVAS